MAHKDCSTLEASFGKYSLQLSYKTLITGLHLIDVHTFASDRCRSDFPRVTFCSRFLCHFSIHISCAPRRLACGEFPRNEIHHVQKLKALEWHVSKTIVPVNEFSDRGRSLSMLVLFRHIVISLWYFGVEGREVLIPIFFLRGCVAPCWWSFDKSSWTYELNTGISELSSITSTPQH